MAAFSRLTDRWRGTRHPDLVGLDIGQRFDGRRLVLPFPFMPHCLIAGETGSGKSSILNSMLYGIAELPNVAVIGIDLKLVELTPWSDRLTAVATEGGSVDEVFADLRLEMDWRQRYLRSIGERIWRPEFGPWIVLLFDELAEMGTMDISRLIEATQLDANTEGDRAKNELMKAARHNMALRSGIFESLARVCRALGVMVVSSTQYPTADVVDTQVRSQHQYRFMCRVSSKEQIKVALGAGMDEVVDVRDISPHQRGTFILAGFESNNVFARASWIDDGMVAERVTETAHLRISPDELFSHSQSVTAPPLVLPSETLPDGLVVFQ